MIQPDYVIMKWRKLFQEGRESLKDDSHSSQHVNVRTHNMAGFLMDACINTGPAQHQEIEMMSGAF